MTPLVSVLIPAYNASRWLKCTLESVLGQRCRRLQVVVVDDGSSDSTLAIASSFSSRGVMVVSQPNRGASAARNRALTLADGEYIQWLDSDDLLAPNKISRQLERAEADASSRHLLSGPFGEFVGDPTSARFTPTPTWRDLAPIDYFLERFVHNAWMFPASWLVSRELTDRVGPWDERLTLDDDGEYFARLVAASAGVLFVPDARAYYRRANPGSLSRSTSEKAAESLLLSTRLCMGYLRELEDTDRTRSAALRFLQGRIDRNNCFDPGRSELFAELALLAEELGGSIAPPCLSWKYRSVQRIFGWGAVRKVRRTAATTRLRACTQVERIRAKRLWRSAFSELAQRRMP